MFMFWRFDIILLAIVYAATVYPAFFTAWVLDERKLKSVIPLLETRVTS